MNSRYGNDGDKSRKNVVETVIATAATIGLSAAVLSRASPSLLSDGLNRFTHAFYLF